jgi:DnaK suppressor protein
MKVIRDAAVLEARLRQRLLEIDEALRQSQEAMDPVKLDQTSVGRLSRMDALQQQATRVGLRDGLKRERRRVEAALARFGDGRYGICCACEIELSIERLRADPAAPFCMECEVEIQERKQNR